MIAKGLQMEDGKLIRGEDFVGMYSQDNADAFVVEKPEEPTPAPTPAPTIVAPTPGPESESSDADVFKFNFQSVH